MIQIQTIDGTKVWIYLHLIWMVIETSEYQVTLRYAGDREFIVTSEEWLRLAPHITMEIVI